MRKEIICSGFGGQGILTAGLILAYAGNKMKNKVSWYPSYGSEMRGGTANCNVKISDQEIGSPISKSPDILLAMNEPAIRKFVGSVKPGGLLAVNSSIVENAEKYAEGLELVEIPANELSSQIGHERGANIVMLGGLIKKTGLFTKEEAEDVLRSYFKEINKESYIEKNLEAFNKGYDYI